MSPLDQTTVNPVETSEDPALGINPPSREDAESAVRTLLTWLGDNPQREGLIDTPQRVVNSFEEFFAGYDVDPHTLLSTTFEDVGDYDDIVLLRDVPFNSHCEHHMVPISGIAQVGYLPRQRVIGISKIARVIDAYARRLQTQETMTSQIARCIDTVLKPRGVAVIVKAQHQCMTTRGVAKPGVSMITRTMLGVFRDEPAMERRFMELLQA